MNQTERIRPPGSYLTGSRSLLIIRSRICPKLVLLSHKLNLDRATSPVPATSNRPRRLGFPLWENRRDGYSIIDRRYRLCRPAMRYNYRPPLLAAVEGLELIPRLVFECRFFHR